MIFIQPGTYEVASSKQKTAFARGTVYFRHGAKSEPGNASDLREFVERELEHARQSWLGNIRRVIEAPLGSVVTISPAAVSKETPSARPVRLVNDPNAPAYGKLDPDVTHPYRQKEVVEKVNGRLVDRKKVIAFDIQCVRQAHLIDESKPQFFHRSKFASPQYSDAFVEWIVGEFDKDDQFFSKARSACKNR